jgi:hypothetical protein
MGIIGLCLYEDRIMKTNRTKKKILVSMSVWADVPTQLLVTAKQVACWGHQAHRSVSCCMAGWRKLQLFVLGSPSPLPRVMLHGRGIKIDFKCFGVTKPITLCHVAWPGHKK